MSWQPWSTCDTCQYSSRCHSNWKRCINPDWVDRLLNFFGYKSRTIRNLEDVKK